MAHKTSVTGTPVTGTPVTGSVPAHLAEAPLTNEAASIDKATQTGDATPTGHGLQTGDATPTGHGTPTGDGTQTGNGTGTSDTSQAGEDPPDGEAPPASAADDLDDPADELDDPADEHRPLGAGLLCLLSLLWLAATIWSAHASVADSSASLSVVISSAAIALPGIIVATLLAGAATGLAAAAHFAGPGHSPLRRGAVGLLAGTVCGLVPAALIFAAYASTSAVSIVALTTLMAGAIGGACAALRPATLAAGIAGTLGVFITGVLLYLFQSPLRALFGAGATVSSQASASRWLSLTGAALSGAVAGVVAYRYLRQREPASRWPAYLLAGGTGGLLLLVAEAITLIGGAGLLDVVSGLSDLDRATIVYLDAARLNQALVVGFAGAIVAMVAVGRTLQRQDQVDADDSDDTDVADDDAEGS